MKGLRRCRKIIIVLCVLFLLTSGCVTQPPAKNVSSSLPSIYSAPIGGFETTWAGVIEPNRVLETNYIFYSRNWGPGEVKYTLTGSYNDTQFVSDPQLFYIDPSSFTAEPGQIYKSYIFLNTSHIPDYIAPDFSCTGANCPGCNSLICIIYPVHLNVNVSLEDNSSHFGDDSLYFYPGMLTGGPFPTNQLSIDNCSIVLKRGETRTFNASFVEDGRGGIGEFSYMSSDTPLNFTITPSIYTGKHILEFPSVISIAADPSLAPGQYPVSLNITINGRASTTMVHCRDRDSYEYIDINQVPPVNFVTLNVTVGVIKNSPTAVFGNEQSLKLTLPDVLDKKILP